MNYDRKYSSVNDRDTSPTINFGSFLVKGVFNRLNIAEYVDLLNYNKDVNVDVNKLMEFLVTSRIVNPCSKLKTFREVFPTLYEYNNDFKLHDVYSGLEFMGLAYENFIEVINRGILNYGKRKTSKVYFDCTNFYFEIDREDELRRKGPSKENRKDPIVSMGLLLDNNCIPIGMKIFPGNESEKPVIREVIDELRKTSNIKGKTIRVADKGLNCMQNILSSELMDDGYIFSQSIKMLPLQEKNWLLNDNDYINTYDDNGELVFKTKSCIDEFPYKYNVNGEMHDIKLKQKRIIVWNKKLHDKKIYEINKMINKAINLCNCQAKKSEFGELSKYIAFESIDGSKVKSKINYEKVDMDKRLAGYNMIITSEVNMDDKEIYDVYKNLWQIEQSFRIMKSDLDARPVFVQNINSIKGHFLVCYLAVVIMRLLQIHSFKGKYKTSDILRFVRGMNYCDSKYDFINLTSKNLDVRELGKVVKLPIDNVFLNDADIRRFFKIKL